MATAVEMGIAPDLGGHEQLARSAPSPGLERKHYGTGYGCEFEADGRAYSPDFAAIARACGADGVRIERADELEPALREAVASGRPSVLDVPMRNTPVLTPGAWDIERIYQAAQ